MLSYFFPNVLLILAFPTSAAYPGCISLTPDPDFLVPGPGSNNNKKRKGKKFAASPFL
jgi:hypothetical protein